jgi:uncharacterized metal-binding protein
VKHYYVLWVYTRHQYHRVCVGLVVGALLNKVLDVVYRVVQTKESNRVAFT